MEITNGTKFRTPFECGCVALESPDNEGNFVGLDREKVRVLFNTIMVFGHPAYKPPPVRAPVRA